MRKTGLSAELLGERGESTLNTGLRTVGGFISVAHEENIERLLAATERTLGERAL